MRSNILRLLVVLVTVGNLLSSCMDDVDNEIVLSSSAMISNVQLGNVRRTMYTKDKEGKDSAYTVAYTASSYAFRIDQINNTITNPEPLLYNSQLNAVLLTISSTGTVQWRKKTDDLNNDEWNYYLSTDSLDVTSPLELRVISTDATQMRVYTLTVRCYKTSPDSLSWKQMVDCPALADNTVQRAVMMDGKPVVIGRDANGGVAAVRPLDDAVRQPCVGADDMDVTTLTRAGQTLYAVSTTGHLLTSTDAINWTDTGKEAASLAGTDRRGNLYVLNANSAIPAYTLGVAQDVTPLSIDTDAKCLPTMNVSGATVETETHQMYHVVAGVRDAAAGDTCAVVWARRMTSDAMMFYPYNNENNYTLPALNDLHVVAHDGRLIALGGASLYGSQRKALGKIYTTPDCGMTWNTRSAWVVPAELQGRTQPLAVAVDADDQPFYVISGTQVWQVVSNRLNAI